MEGKKLKQEKKTQENSPEFKVSPQIKRAVRYPIQ